MAIFDSQKVDYLWKKLGYGRSKTDIVSIKNATNESIASPLFLRGDVIWSQSDFIPSVIPGSSAGVVDVYTTAAPVECVADITASQYRTWKTNIIDWIPPEIGATYNVKVYIHTSGQSGNAAASGVQVFAAGSGNDDEWFFDYQSGVLHFIGDNLPNGVNFSGKSVYVSGAVYTGIKGVPAPGAAISFTTIEVSQNSDFTGISTFGGYVDANGGAYIDEIQIGITGDNEIDTTSGNLTIDSFEGTVTIDDQLIVTGIGTFNIDVDIDRDLNVDRNVTVTGLSTFTGTADLNGGAYIDEIQIGITDDNEIDTTSGNLTLDSADGTITIDDQLVVTGIGTFNVDVDIDRDLNVDRNLTVTGLSTFTGTVDANGGAYIDEIQIGITGDNEIDTTSGNLTIDSADGTTTIDDQLVVTGIGTFNVDVDIDRDLNVDRNVTVTGLSTFTGNVDIDGSVDIDGHTELDELGVTGLSTFSANVRITPGTTLQFGDGYELQVYHSGVSGDGYIRNSTGDLNLRVDSGSFIFSKGLGAEKLAEFSTDGSVDLYYDNSKKFETTDDGIDVTGHIETDTLNVSGLSTFFGNADLNGDLDVDGRTELDTTNISETLNVVGISTFASDVDIDGDLDVDGRTELDTTNISETLNVVGVSTFASDVDIDGDLDVDGRTELDTTNISETLNVVGVSTFASDVDINANVEISGNLTLSTDLDVDGHTELDNVNASGIITATAFHTGLEGSSIRVTSDSITGPSTITIDPSGVGDNTGTVIIAGDLQVDGTQTIINSTSISIDDLNIMLADGAANDAAANGGGITVQSGEGDKTFQFEATGDNFGSSENINLASGKTYKIANTEVLSSTLLTVANINSSGIATIFEVDATNIESETLTVSTITANGDVDFNSSLDVDGDTELDRVNISENLTVAGLSTFSSVGDFTVGSYFDEVQVGISSINEIDTIAGNLILDSAAGTVIVDDQLSVTGISTFSSNVDISGELAVTANSTFSLDITVNGNTDLNGDLDVDGRTELDDVNIDNTLNVVGVSTFGSSVDIDGDTDIMGSTELDWVNIDNTLNVVGVSTFNSDIDINASIDVSNNISAATLNVSGVSTFVGNIDADGNLDLLGNLDVDGSTTLDAVTIAETLDVVGDATFINVDIDGDAVLDNVVISGIATVSGNADFDGNLDLLGNLDVTGNLDVDGSTTLDAVTISETLGVTQTATFSSNVDVTGNLDVDGTIDVDGHSELDSVNVSENLSVTGIATFSSNVDVTGNLDVDGSTTLDAVTISETLGVTQTATFSSNVDVTGNLDVDGTIDVDGHSELDSVNISENLTVSGIATFSSNVNVTGNLDVDGSTTLDAVTISETLDVTGATSFGSDLDINASIDVDGHTELDDLNVSGVSTFVGNIDADGNLDLLGNLDVDGSTTLDAVTISETLGVTGVVTLSSDLDVDGATTLDTTTIDGTLTVNTGEIHGNAGLTVNTAVVEDLTDNRVVIAGAGGELEDDGNLTFNGTTLSVGVALDVDGDTELDRVNISENLTVSGIATVSGDFDVDGATTLDAVTISETLSVIQTATFTGNIDANGNLDVDGSTELDSVNISETLTVTQTATFNSNIDANGDLDVDGTTDLDDTNIVGALNVTGNSTFIGNVDIQGVLTYEDVTNVDAIGIATARVGLDVLAGGIDVSAGGVNVVGVSTFTSDVNFNAGIDVDGATTLDAVTISETLGVTGASTFTGNIDANGDLDVDGHTELDNVNAGIITATKFDGDLNAPGKTYYVATTGSNSNSGNNINEPYLTIEQALSVATNGDIINVSAGVYEETCPLTVPRGVTIKGAGLRATTIRPTTATQQENIFLLNDISTVEDFTIRGSYFDSTADTGYAFSYATGIAITTRSPYIQRVTVLNTGSVITTDDPYGYDTADSPPTSYIAGAGAKIDGSLVASNSLEAGMLFNEVTFFTPNNKGIVLTNGARAEYLNCFHYFASQAIVGIAGTTGIAGTADARLKFRTPSVTPAVNDVVKLFDSGGVGIATGTIVTYSNDYATIDGLGIGTFTSVGAGSTQDVRFYQSDGVTQTGIASAISLADYTMFGAEMRSVGCAVEYGSEGVVADGNGVKLRLFATNFNHVGSGKDFSNDNTLVNQSNEVIELNDGQVSYVSIDQKGDFRVGDSLYINQETGNVAFAATEYNLEVTGNMDVTDGVDTSTLSPTSLTVGSLSLSGSTVATTSGNLILDPAGSNKTIVQGNLGVVGILTASVINVDAFQKGDTSISITDTGTDGTIIVSTDGTEAFRVNNAQTTVFTGNIDANGTTDLSATTVGGLLDINAGATANTLAVEDLTDNRIVIAGAGGELEDDANLTFDGSTFTVGVGIDVDGHTELDDVNVSGFLTATSAYFSGSVSIGGTLTYEDVTNIDSVGIVTANSGIDVLAGGINVTGVSTFSSDIDVNASIDVSSNTKTGTLNVVGVSTFTNTVTVNNSSVQITNSGSSGNYLDLKQNSDGTTELNKVGGSAFYIGGNNVFIKDDGSNEVYAGFQKDGSVYLNYDNVKKLETTDGGVDVTGHTETDTLNVSGVSTFVGNIDADGNLDLLGNLDVDGHTELDNVNVSGFSTFSGALFVGNVSITGDFDTNGTIEGDFLTISGISTFSSDVDVNASVDVSANTNTGTLNVVGVSTFAETSNFNHIDVDGHTELDNVNVSGVSTFVSTANFTGDIDVDGTANLDDVIIAGALSVTGDSLITGVSTFIGNVDIQGILTYEDVTNVDSVGIATARVGLDVLAGGINVTGVSTFQNDLVVSGNATLSSDLDVDGVSELDITNISETLNVVGVSTFASDTNFSSNIDVDGHTELDDVNVSGVSTFVGVGTFINDLYIGGILHAPSFNAGGGATFGEDISARDITATRDLDVDGHTELDDVNVSGVSTFANTTNITNLSVSGVGTFSGNVDVTGNVTANTLNGNVYAIGSGEALHGTHVGSISWNGVDPSGDFILTPGDGNVAAAFTGNVTGNTTGQHNGDVYYSDGSGYVLVVGSGIGQTSQLYNTNLYNSLGQVITEVTAGYEHFAGTSEGLTGTPDITVGNINATGIITATAFAGDVYYSDGSGYVLVVGSGIGQTSQLYNTNLYNSLGQVITEVTAGYEHFAGTSEGLTGTPDITVGTVTASDLNVSGGVNVSGITTSTSFDTTHSRNGSVILATNAITTLSGLDLDISTFRSAEILIQAVEGINVHMAKLLVIHDGTSAYLTQYGSVFSSDILATFDVIISGSDMKLMVTPSSTLPTEFKIEYTAIKV